MATQAGEHQDIVGASRVAVRRTWVAHSIVLVSYAIVTLLIWLPILPVWTSAIGVRSGVGQQDGWQNVWMLWWFQRAVASGQSPFFTRMLYYPIGTDLFWQTLNASNGVISLPFTTIFNAIASFNLLAMLTCVVSGYAMYCLARFLTGSHPAAWLAGALYTFAPVHLAKIYDGQLELMSIQYFPLLVWSLLLAFDRRRGRYTLVAGLIVAWIALTSLYYGLYSLIFAGLYVLLTIALSRTWRERGLVLLRSVLLIVPFLLLAIPHLNQRSIGPKPGWRGEQISHSATPLDLILPSPYHPWWGAAIAQLQTHLHPDTASYTVSLGIVASVLALVSLVLVPRKVWRWGLLTTLLLLLACGPVLVWNGTTTGILLPYSLLNLLPGGNIGRRPNLFAPLAATLVCIMAAYGWQAIAQRLSTVGASTLMLIAVACATIELWPAQVRPDALPVAAFYHDLPAGTGAILEFPPPNKDSTALAAQMVHGRPILGGYLARRPDDAYTDSIDGLRRFWQTPDKRVSLLEPQHASALVPTLAAYGIDYVILNLDQIPPEYRLQFQPLLDAQMDLVYKDAQKIVYRRPGPSNLQPVLSLQDGWYPMETHGTDRWQWTAPEAEIHILNPSEHAMSVEVTLSLATFSSNQPVQIAIQTGERWERLATYKGVPTQRQYSLTMDVPPGKTVLRLEVPGYPPPLEEGRALGAKVASLDVIPLTEPVAH